MYHIYYILRLPALGSKQGFCMKLRPAQKFDPIGFTLGLLAFSTIIVQVFGSNKIPTHSVLRYAIQTAFSFFIGLFLLYTSLKNFRQIKDQQEQRWYTQPSILLGLGVFLTTPFNSLYLLIGETATNALSLPIEMALFAPSILCLLVAGFFYIRARRLKH